jgi:hypothetical protein
MGSTLVTGGDYLVELDTGEIEDGFTLGDATRGVLGSTTYVLAGTTTFTDVSELVTSLQIRRGRRKIKDQFVAGSVQIALFDNTNRDLDPYNEDSAFFNVSAELPGLSPNRRIRISRNGTYIFQGRVTGYTYDYGEQNVVIITGADDFVLLASIELDAQTPTEQTSAARLSAILDLAAVSWGTNRDITTSPDTTLGAYPISDGTNVLAYLQKIALKAEYGRLYMRAADNYLVFEQRIGNTLSAPSVTFADVGVGLPYNRLSIDYTADDVINKATIKRTGGTDQTAQDATSISTYYVQEYADTDNLVSTDAQALTLANYLLFPTPEPRFTALEVSFASISNEADQDSIAYLEIGETIEITRTFATGSPASITEELAIEGIEHRIEAGRGHFVTLYTSPTDVVYSFVIGDAVYGILGVTDPQPVLT